MATDFFVNCTRRPGFALRTRGPLRGPPVHLHPKGVRNWVNFELEQNGLHHNAFQVTWEFWCVITVNNWVELADNHPLVLHFWRKNRGPEVRPWGSPPPRSCPKILNFKMAEIQLYHNSFQAISRFWPPYRFNHRAAKVPTGQKS